MKSVSILTILVLLFGYSLFNGCSKGEELNIYSSRHYDTDLQLYAEFTKQTGIKINLIEGGSDELIERIKSEGINSPADLVITVDAGRLWRAKEAGVLSGVESDVLFERIPAELRDVDNQWFGLSQRIRGIVYNKSVVSGNDLQGYLQLSDSVWSGRICVRSSNNIYNQSMVASLIESIGVEAAEKWATELVSNFARSPQGGDTDQIKAVAAGVCDVALANHYYLARLIDSENASDREIADAVGIYFPSTEYNGVHVNISGAGVAAHSPNRRNAIRFLEYLTEENAQSYFSGGNYEYPVSADTVLPDILELFGRFTSDAVNVSAYGRNNPDAIRLMDRAGWR